MAYGENPMNAFVALVMQGQAKAQGDAAARDLLEKQTKEAAKSEVSFKGDGTVVLKGAADQLLSNVTPDRQVQDTYDAPRKRVDEKLASAVKQQEEEQNFGSELPALHSQLESFGLRPRSKQLAKAENADSYLEGYHASRELDQNPILAAVDGLRAWAGKRVGSRMGATAPASVADQLNRKRVKEDVADYLRFIAPTKSAMAGEARRDEPERIRPTNFATMVNSIDASDYSTVEEFLAALPELTGIAPEQLPPGARGMALAAMNKQKNQTQKQKDATKKQTLSMFLTQVELGQYDSFDRVSNLMDASSNVEWGDADREKVRVEWEAKRKKYIENETDRKRAEERYIDSQTPKPDKPTSQWADEDLIASDDPKAKKLLNSRAQAIDEQIAAAERKIVSLDARGKTYKSQYEEESKKKGWLDTADAAGFRGRAEQMAAEREALASLIEDLRVRKARLRPSATAPEIRPPAPGQVPPTPAGGGRAWRRVN